MVDDDYLSVKVSVLVPALQSLVTSVFWFLAVFGLVAVAKYAELLSVPPWAPGVVAFSLAGLVTWGKLLDDWRRLHYGIEPEPEPAPVILQPKPIRVELASNNGRSVQFIDLPARPDQLHALGSGLVDGQSLTEAVWVGSGAPFSRGEFVRLRDAMILRGLAVWNSDRDTARGVRVTSKGMAVFRFIAHDPTTLRSRR